MKARKLPIVIDAFKLTREVSAKTLEGTMTGNPGDWMLVGVEGEVYFCKDSVFQKSYEIVQDHVTIQKKQDVVVHKIVEPILNDEKPDNEQNEVKPLKKSVYSGVTTKKPAKKEVIKTHPGKPSNFKVPSWTEAERDCIKDEPNKEAAIKAYREKFPAHSFRNDMAIYQKWGVLTREKRFAEDKKVLKKSQSDSDKITIPVGSESIPPDANGKPLFVGAKVTQILANGSTRAFGVGTVMSFSEGKCKVCFPNSTKILEGDHFVLYQPEATAAAMSK